MMRWMGFGLLASSLALWAAAGCGDDGDGDGGGDGGTGGQGATTASGGSAEGGTW
ncbi:MAG: hypothetical protein JRI23_35670, partial [Deltaproteobacteria bacterium]|nr:hypothetical protein [Deltaproteobacteria bacterium]MBW2537670.1 hypothetical protein [Deltaproteobacteria bacterium]